MTTEIIFRPIEEWPYLIGSNRAVWSESRVVRCKGGGKRTVPAKQVKPTKGWVSLCREGEKRSFRVETLFAKGFPELAHPKCQVECRKGHPLIECEHELLAQWMTPKPAVRLWGTGNRICLHCHPEPASFDKGSYSLHFGVGRSCHALRH
ncbi:hypothetical protein [Mycobacterium shigaense]|uniref:Uncharacterized protein n=1 Tax=Mycobacterium shigaense TaxID=722731 RepID=A0A1Z4EGF1_9MYCO|nr:hypothetical protein [Mycobacterium shigaense]PRI16730.1 hypothetical protein B2J96_03505 [Mycobacterium shigaense]BAX92037.1 hypothetical protein MSG_01884 [Mycobacterium shigaense]